MRRSIFSQRNIRTSLKQISLLRKDISSFCPVNSTLSYDAMSKQDMLKVQVLFQSIFFLASNAVNLELEAETEILAFFCFVFVLFFHLILINLFNLLFCLLMCVLINDNCRHVF